MTEKKKTSRYFTVFYEGENVEEEVKVGTKNIEVINGHFLNYKWTINKIMIEEQLISCVMISPPYEFKNKEDYEDWTKTRMI